MLSVETGKNSIPVLRIDAIVALAQFRQIGLAIDDKAMSLITAIRRLQHKKVVFPTVMYQFATNKRCTAFFNQQVSWASAAC